MNHAIIIVSVWAYACVIVYNGYVTYIMICSLDP